MGAPPEGAAPGRLVAIWIKRAKLGPMDPAARAELVAGQGIVRNANQGGFRQVTVLSADRWREVQAELGAPVPPTARRANLFVEGVELAESRGHVLRVGSCRLLVRGETRPCERMERAHPGLKAALAPQWRGGVYAEIVEGGPIAEGDAVGWE